jgi:DNA-binding protein HU-beta
VARRRLRLANRPAEAEFVRGGDQIRHLARISTVDNSEIEELNSFRRVSTLNELQSVSRGAEVAEKKETSPGAKMNKADLIDRIASGCGVSKTQAATAIDTTVDSITSALKKGDRVALIGFGTFSVSQRKARNGRNPQTGATLKIAARRVAKFTAGADLKKAVNRGK